MILTANIGSASKKYSLYENGKRVFSAHFEHEKEKFSVSSGFGEEEKTAPIGEGDYRTALSYLLGLMIDRNTISSAEDIGHAAVRIAAPGEYFSAHRVLDEDYLKRLSAASEIAPLHAELALEEIKEISRLLPGAKIAGISDSAFHATLPDAAKYYALPKGVAESFGVRRYGYHGLSAESAVGKLKNMHGGLGARVVVCHLGSGASVTALKNGESIDTSMGFTPLEGVPMGSRSGSIDAEAVLFLQKSLGLSPDKMSSYLNSKSGLLGVSGKTADIRELLALEEKDRDAKLALQMFVYRTKQYIGAYMATLGGIDTLVFTGTAGERSPKIRARICENLGEFGIKIDSKENELYSGGRDGFIQSTASQASVAVLVSDEAAVMEKTASALFG